MKAPAIALTVCGFIVAVILILIYLFKRGREEKENKIRPGKARTRTTNLPHKTYHDPGHYVEANGIRDGSMDVVAGTAAVAIATTSMMASITDGGGGSSDSGWGGSDIVNGNVGVSTEGGEAASGGGSGGGGADG